VKILTKKTGLNFKRLVSYSWIAFLLVLLVILGFFASIYINSLLAAYSFLGIVVLTTIVIKSLLVGENNLVKMVLAIVLVLLTGYFSGIVTGSIQGNGYSPGIVNPLYFTTKKEGFQEGWKVLLKPHLKWYDKFFIVGLVEVSDGGKKTMSISDAEEILEMSKNERYCKKEGEPGYWQSSLPTRSYFGLYYKNYLVTCDRVDYSTWNGFGRIFPR
jgi:hypothetical protein